MREANIKNGNLASLMFETPTKAAVCSSAAEKEAWLVIHA